MDFQDKLIISRPLYLSDRHCGYCHQKKPKEQAVSLSSWLDKSSPDFFPESVTTGFQIESMTMHHYNKLINLGYRRSGNFLYKPDLLRTCCRMYTIRTNWDHFHPQKEHRRDINKFNKHLGLERKDNGHFDMVSELNKCMESGDLRLNFEKSVFTQPKYDLFVKYQRDIHDDKDTSKKGFIRFLCKNPFTTQGQVENGKVVEYGAIHQCYYLKDKLIAVAVLDLLPSGISSVYFFYDPEYKQLTLGKISGLREMILCKELGLEWYYLGYYIEDCPKMSYKKKFGAQILNPLDGEYYDYDKIKKALHNGRLLSWRDDDDVAEELYGVEGKAYPQTEEDAKEIKKKYNIAYLQVGWDLFEGKTTEDDESDMFDIPGVLVGCISLHSMLQDCKRLEKSKLRVLQGPMPLQVLFTDLTPRFQKTVIDTVRLVGWSLFEDCVLSI